MVYKSANSCFKSYLQGLGTYILCSNLSRSSICSIPNNSLASLLFSCSYLAVHSSADAVRVLCRRGDQPSLRTALQVLLESVAFFVLFCLFVFFFRKSAAMLDSIKI